MYIIKQNHSIIDINICTIINNNDILYSAKMFLILNSLSSLIYLLYFFTTLEIPINYRKTV